MLSGVRFLSVQAPPSGRSWTGAADPKIRVVHASHRFLMVMVTNTLVNVESLRYKKGYLSGSCVYPLVL